MAKSPEYAGEQLTRPLATLWSSLVIERRRQTYPDDLSLTYFCKYDGMSPASFLSAAPPPLPVASYVFIPLVGLRTTYTREQMQLIDEKEVHVNRTRVTHTVRLVDIVGPCSVEAIGDGTSGGLAS